MQQRIIENVFAVCRGLWSAEAPTDPKIPRSLKWPESDFKFGSPLAIYRGLSGAPGPKPEKVWKKSPGASGLGPPRESGKKSRKSLFGTFSRLFPDSRDFFQTFFRLSGALGPEAPGDFFQTFSGFRAWRARETPVNGQRAPNFKFGPQAKWPLKGSKMT